MQIIDTSVGLDAARILESVAESLPVPLFLISASGRYLAVLGANDRASHHDPTPLIGRNLQDMLPPELAERFLDAIRQTLEDGQTHRLEFVIPASTLDGHETARGPDGDAWFEATVCPATGLRLPEAVVVTIINNITELVSHRNELTRLATIDSLTGLLNRRAFIDRSELLFREADSCDMPVSIGLVDLDHFKDVNDRYGHDFGDKALVHASRLLMDSIRTSDVCARLGGEEFAVLLPGANEIRAHELLESLRRKFESTPLNFGDTKIALHLSAGVAERSAGEILTDLLRRADLNLYSAKNAGRNRVHDTRSGS